MPDQYHLSCCYREQVTYLLYSTFREPKLFRLAVTGEWETIPSRCQSHPREATFVHKYAPNDTALHRVLRRDNNNNTNNRSCCSSDNGGTAEVAGVCATPTIPTSTASTAAADSSKQETPCPSTPDQVKLQAVQALLQVHPRAAAQGDSFGRTPLHLACMDASQCGIDCARLLIPALESTSLHQSSSSTVLCGKDVEGRTPLHWLLLRHDNVPLDVLDWMLRAAPPEALHIADAVRETPLDIVRRRRTKIQNYDAVVKRLLQYAPQASLDVSTSSSALSSMAGTALSSPRTTRTKLVGLQDLPPCSSSKASAGAAA